MRTATFVLSIGLFLSQGCELGPPLAFDGGNERLDRAETAGIAEGTPEAIAILQVVNLSSATQLGAGVGRVGLSQEAANAIVRTRIGDDLEVGTADDTRFVALSQLDEVAFVGPPEFELLRLYAWQHGFVDEALPLACPEGSRERDGLCMLDEVCVEGETLRDGTCVRELVCAEGETVRDGECVFGSVVSPRIVVSLPFLPGTTVGVSQGNHGTLSHKNKDRHAIDFPLPAGTPVVAARAGRVLIAKTGSTRGCGNLSCAPYTNYVILDHGDGTFARYWHLQSTPLLAGTWICAGELVGYVGSTGWSTGPHLHFSVSDVYGETLPVRFTDISGLGGGAAFEGGTFTSEGNFGACAAELPLTSCPEETFAHRGIVLDAAGPSCSAAIADTEVVYTGRVGIPGARIVASLRRESNGGLENFCTDADAEGRFSLPVRWDSAQHGTKSGLHLSIGRAGRCSSAADWSAEAAVFVVR